MTGGHFRAGATIDDMDAFRAHAQGGAGGVHGHVARAEDRDVLAVEGRSVVVGEVVGAAEVHAGQVFVGRKDPDQILTGHAEEYRQTGTHADEHGVVFLGQFGDADGAAAHVVEVEVHAGLAQAVHFGGHHVLGQTEGRDTVDEHAARLMQGLEHVHLDARGGTDARAGQRGRTGADAGHLLAAHRHGAGIGARDLLTGRGRDMVVGHEALQTADGHRLSLGLEHAVAFALIFLRADAAADGGQTVGGLDDAVGRVEIAARHFTDEVADGHLHRAALDAAGILALQAAGGLLQGHFLGIAEGHLVKVAGAHVGGLTGHVRTRGDGLFFFSFHAGSCTDRGRSSPVRGKRRGGGAVRQSPPDARRIRGRPHRRTWSCRPRSHDRRRTCRCRPP